MAVNRTQPNEQVPEPQEEPGQSTEALEDGEGGATPDPPKKHWVENRWMSSEELIEQNSKLKLDNAKLEGRLTERTPDPAATPATPTPTQGNLPVPPWARAMLDAGHDQEEVAQLIVDENARQDQSVRTILQDELKNIGQQAQERLTAQEKADLDMKGDYSDYSRDLIDKFMADDPVTKSSFETLEAAGQHYQARIGAWRAYMLSQGSKPAPSAAKGRSHMTVPQQRSARRDAQETQERGGGENRVDEQTREAVFAGGSKADKLAYMRQFRKDTTIDLTTPGPDPNAR